MPAGTHRRRENSYRLPRRRFGNSRIIAGRTRCGAVAGSQQYYPDQTADALRDPRHPYRQALELSCGNVEVLTIEEALHLSRASVDGQTIVIVSTIQSFRVEDTTGRQVYSQNGAFSEHL